MKYNLLRNIASGLMLLVGATMNAQTNDSDAARWLAKAELAPAFQAPASKAVWESERGQIRAQLWDLLGKLPPRPKVPKVEVLSREEREGCTVERFQFDNGAGATVPGYLILPPDARGKSPAILYCHVHGGRYQVGKEELFEARPVPEAPGPVLARRGFVVLGIDCYCFGERNGRGPDGPEEKGTEGEWSAAKFNLWVGRTLWGMIVRDDLMALDYLESRPEVDTNRVGVLGMSLGATRAWWLMALDERLKAGVPVCCMTRYRDLIEQGQLKAHGIYYFVPNLLNDFDSESIIALIAPRPVLFLDGDRDSTSPVSGIRVIEQAVRPVYRLYSQAARFESVVYTGQGHVYTPAMWQRTLEWLDQNLKSPRAK